MTGRRRGVLAVALLLAACSAPGDAVISPKEAVMLAADAAPAGVRGTFEMQVRRTGRQDGNIYLDSELDYRDQRNLTIAVHPRAAAKFHEQFGQEIDEIILGKRIRVSGEAHRAKIVFTANGQRTGDYYYQTHVEIWDAGQLTILP